MKTAMTMNKMGEQPIPKLLLTMGLPMILSMILQAFYNIVDSYFVSCIVDSTSGANLGEYATNALTLAFPIQMLMIAIGVGTGVGINSILSKTLGEQNSHKVAQIAGNAIFLGICTCIVFLGFGIVGVNFYLQSQTQDAMILEMGSSYLKICSILSFGAIMFMIYEKLLQSTGKTTLSMIAQIAGALTNIILDPILIFGYFGLPAMGIEGAAYATVIGQMVSLIIGILCHHLLNKEVLFKFSYLKPNVSIIKEIYKVGIPAIIMQALMAFMTYGTNIILGLISSNAVTAYGIYYKIQQFVLFAAFGMNNAMIPIISFNYGKHDKQRINEGIKYGMKYTLIIMLIGMILLQLFSSQIIGIFSISSKTHELCILAIRIITLGYLFMGANVAYQGIFQALGCGVRSLIISLLRLIIIALPLTWVFTQFSNAEYIVWSAFPIAEFVALVVAILFMKKVSHEKIIKEEDQDLSLNQAYSLK